MLKPPITYIEQVEKLKEYGFIIEDIDHTCKFLQNINYYRLSAYFLPFQVFEDKKVHDIPFSRVVSIYRFDACLRLLVLAIIEDIEQYAKTQIAYYVAHKYGSEAYLDKEMFADLHSHEKFLKILVRSKEDNRKHPVIIHHEKCYDGHMPIWAVVEFFSMGVLSRFYSNMKTSDKKRVAREFFNTGHKQLESWFRVLTDLRNKCAHFTRLYYWDFISVPKNDNKGHWKMDKSFFSQIFMLKLLHRNQNRWNEHFNSLNSLLCEYKDDIDLKHIGFNDDWKSLLQCGI